MNSFTNRYIKSKQKDLLLEAVMAGKCIYFEGEDVPPIPDDDGGKDDSKSNDDQQTQDQEQDQGQDQSQGQPQQGQEQQPQQEQPQQQPQETAPSAENVNAEHDTTGSQKVDAATLASKFAASGWLKKILMYALNKLTEGKGGMQPTNEAVNPKTSSKYINAATKKPITTGDLKPFISAALTKFAHDNKLLATPTVINAAALIVAHNTGANTIKEKIAQQNMQQKAMQKSKQNPPAPPEGAPSGGEGGGMPSGGDSAPSEAPSGGEEPQAPEEPAPDQGGSDQPQETPPQESDDSNQEQ